MQRLKKDNLIYEFKRENKPVYFVEDGEVFWVETPDCYLGQIRDEQTLRTDIDSSVIDASVGPINVAGATAEDVLCVEVLDIKLDSQGVMITNKGLGVLGEHMDKAVTKVVEIEGNFAIFNDEIKIPLNPMIGILGVAPVDCVKGCEVPGNFGGNMDTKEVAVGSKVYLPIYVEGANFALSDVHAAMGDGELSGTGIEIAAEVQLRVKVIKGKTIEKPIIEIEDFFYILVTEETFEEALKEASRETVKLLMRKLDLIFEEAYMLMSATCDIAISQVVNGVYTLKMKIPKYLVQSVF